MKKISIATIVMLLGSTAMASAQNKDLFKYPITEDREQLRNVFLRSYFMNDNKDVYINDVSGGDSRGFVEKDGKLYFVSRKSNTAGSYGPQIFEVDGTTGELLHTYDLPDALFGTLPYPANGIANDSEGNLYVSNMVTSSGSIFRIVRITELSTSSVTGVTLLDATSTGRWETFDVHGNLKNGDGFILVPTTNSNSVAKFDVTGGAVTSTTPSMITLDRFYPASYTSVGENPKICIASDDSFYLDGTLRDPVLYNVTGTAIDGFYNNEPLAPTNIPDGGGKPGGQNGVVEFEVGGQHYLIVASTNTDYATPQQFDLLRFEDGNKEFSKLKFMYRFPNAGMGRAQNGCASLIRAKIITEGGESKARIFIFGYRNGYGIYDLHLDVEDDPSAQYNMWLEAPAIAILENGDALIVGPDAEKFTKFYINGTQVALTDKKADLSQVSGEVSLKAVTEDGSQVIRLKITKQ